MSLYFREIDGHQHCHHYQFYRETELIKKKHLIQLLSIVRSQGENSTEMSSVAQFISSNHFFIYSNKIPISHITAGGLHNPAQG